MYPLSPALPAGIAFPGRTWGSSQKRQKLAEGGLRSVVNSCHCSVSIEFKSGFPQTAHFPSTLFPSRWGRRGWYTFELCPSPPEARR